jgi:uncharacterized protein
MSETNALRELVPARFAADRSLMRLARWLRLMGADVLCDAALDSAATLHRARLEGRRMLTRDKRLRTASDATYLHEHHFRSQIREVFEQHPFDAMRFAFTRCSRCNEPLRTVGREAVMRRVAPFVYANNEQFARCDRCDRIYWNATHPAHMLDELIAFGLHPASSPGLARARAGLS